MPNILLRHRDIADLDKLDVYRKNGGLEAFKKVVTQMQPGQVHRYRQGLRLTRPRRRGFPHRREMVLY